MPPLPWYQNITLDYGTSLSTKNSQIFYSPHTHDQMYYAYNHIFQFPDRMYQHDYYTCMECM